MLEALLGMGVSALGGGVTGLLGAGVKMLFSWLGDREKRAMRREEMEHERTLRKMDLEAGDKIAERDYRREVEVAAEETRQASYGFANVTGPVWKAVSSIVSLMRPAITIYLLVAFSFLGWTLLRGAPIPYVDTPKFVNEVVNGLVYLTVTAVTWWFGDRPPQARK